VWLAVFADQQDRRKHKTKKTTLPKVHKHTKSKKTDEKVPKMVSLAETTNFIGTKKSYA
jgi:hypothetical protein